MMTRTWIDHEYAKQFPDPPPQIRAAIAWLDHDPPVPLPKEAGAAIQHTKDLISCLTTMIAIDELRSGWLRYLHLVDEVQELANAQSMSGAWLDWNYHVVLRVRLRKLLPEADDPPIMPAPASCGWCDIDDEQWRAAVTQQGVRIPYGDEYLHTTHWQLLRDELRTGRCSDCGEIGRTDLHHLTYARIGRERPEDVRELCRTCHQIWHGWRRRKAA
jgi:hypothetical protein